MEPFSSDPRTTLKTQIPMQPIGWGCPKITRHSDPISLLISTFGIHHEPGCKSHGQIIYYCLLKLSKNKRQFCSIFRRILSIDPEDISCAGYVSGECSWCPEVYSTGILVTKLIFMSRQWHTKSRRDDWHL